MDKRVMRWDVINLLINNFSIQAYLEIGLADGATFFRVKAPRKLGVDPDTIPFWKGARAVGYQGKQDIIFKERSDAFFGELGRDMQPDLVFIDGLHKAEQVQKDIINSLNYLTPKGFIVLHDTLPPDESYATEMPTHLAPSGRYLWCGDVWRIFNWLWKQENLWFGSVDEDYGCTIITRGALAERISPPNNFKEFKANQSIIARVFNFEAILDELHNA